MKLGALKQEVCAAVDDLKGELLRVSRAIHARPELAFEERIVKMSLERAKFEDLHKDPRLKKVGDPFYNDLQGYALKKLSYYNCFKCSN